MPKPFDSVSLVIPAYNESQRILPVLENYRDFLSRSFSRFELIVVPNHCSDDTPQIAQSFARENPGVLVLNFPEYTGKGGAVREGFRIARFDWVGFVDSDESTAPSEFNKLCNALNENSKIAGAVGSRAVRGSRLLKRQPLYRVFLGKCMNVVVFALFGLTYADTQCGAKLFRKSALSRVLPFLRVKGWEFDVELLWRLKQKGFLVEEVPIDWRNDERTKLGLKNVLDMLVGLIRLRFSWK